MENLGKNSLRMLSQSTFISLIFLTGCAQMIPGLMTAIDDAVTDEAVCVSIDKGAMQKNTDVTIEVEIRNRPPILPNPKG
jgi:hypothetical protein